MEKKVFLMLWRHGNMFTKIISRLFDSRNRDASNNKTGRIVNQIAQTSSADFYDIEVDGRQIKNIQCPLPDWLIKTLEEEDQAVLNYYNGDKKVYSRAFLFQVDESINVTYDSGNINNIKISIDGPGKKYKELKIVYV